VIQVFGIPHHPNAARYVEQMILRDTPDVVGVERHQEVLEHLVHVLERGPKTDEEKRTVKLEAGDGIVAAVESARRTGSRLVGLEPERGYNVSRSDIRGDLWGKFWKGFEAWFEDAVGARLDRMGQLNPSAYQSSGAMAIKEHLARWAWRRYWYPGYVTAALHREEAYAKTLVRLEQEERARLGRDPKVYFFVGAGHKWNTEKLVRKERSKEESTRIGETSHQTLA